jgi:hypothetical protein
MKYAQINALTEWNVMQCYNRRANETLRYFQMLIALRHTPVNRCDQYLADVVTVCGIEKEYMRHHK